MPRRKLTFTLPQDLASELLRRVPASSVTICGDSDCRQTREHEEQLVRACEAANNSTAVREIESSFDALADESDAVQEQR
jgi:hypothetical protein